MAGPFKLDNGYANYEGHWLANTAYALGKRVIAESTNTGDARKYVFECTTAGTSADPGPPTWVITPGNTTSDGTVTWTCREATTWDNAHGKIAWVCLVPAAGEILHVEQYHKETLTPVNLYFNGTEGNPVKVIVVDKATDIAVADYNSTNQYITYDSYTRFYGELYFWGFCIINTCQFPILSSGYTTILEKSFIKFDHTTSSKGISVNGDNTTLKLIDSDLEFGGSGQYVYVNGPSTFIWRGGSLTYDIDKLVSVGIEGPYVEITGVDLSAMIDGVIFDIYEGDERFHAYLKGIKLNATQPALITAGISPERHSQILMDIADSGNTVYKFRREYQYGYAQDETTKVITGKALYDGTNEFTAKMVSRATPTPTFYDPWRYHLTTLRETGFAASRTYTVHIAQDHASVQPDALDDDEIWLEVVYPDDSTAQYNIKTDKIATPTTTPAAQTTSTETWEGLLSTTRLQELAVQIDAAAGKNGPVEIWVCLAKESKTVYVCPEVYVS